MLTLPQTDVGVVAVGCVSQGGQVAVASQRPAVQSPRAERETAHRADVQTQGAGLDAGVGGHLAEEGTEMKTILSVA